MALYDTVLITGGGGMLAFALRQTLAARGITAISLPRAEFDLNHPETFRATIAKHRPTLVLNTAAHTKVDLCEKELDRANATNGDAVGTLAAACKDVDAALVHYSTDYVFDGTLRRPLRPNDPVGPASAYGKSKLLGEQKLQAIAPARWLILRTSWLYGIGGPCFPMTMVNAARAGKPLKVVSDQIGSPTYTADLAAATFDLLNAGANGIFHVANAGETNWQAFAQATLDAFGVPATVGSLTSAEWQTIRPDSAPRPAYSVFDLTPLEKAIGRPMPSWTDALSRYHDAVAAAEQTS